jgi:hypothetical protein
MTTPSRFHAPPSLGPLSEVLLREIRNDFRSLEQKIEAYITDSAEKKQSLDALQGAYLWAETALRQDGPNPNGSLLADGPDGKSEAEPVF